jgi:hypothetical protein
MLQMHSLIPEISGRKHGKHQERGGRKWEIFGFIHFLVRYSQKLVYLTLQSLGHLAQCICIRLMLGNRVSPSQYQNGVKKMSFPKVQVSVLA